MAVVGLVLSGEEQPANRTSGSKTVAIFMTLSCRCHGISVRCSRPSGLALATLYILKSSNATLSSLTPSFACN